jgi:hypothetical protein
MCQISTGLDVWQVVRRFCTIGLEWWGGNGDAWLLWDPSLDSGSNTQEHTCGRVDGIIETCKIATIILKIHPRPASRTRINKQTNTYLFR